MLIFLGKFWYCRLSPNHKFFHYGDCEEDAQPQCEQLKDKGNFNNLVLNANTSGYIPYLNFGICNE